jgi:hypothetical protein
MARLDEALKEQHLETGASFFFRKHKDIAPLDANVAILASEIQKQNLPLDKIESWEKAFEVVGNSLAEKVRVTPTPSEPEPQKWPYPWCPEIHSYADIQAIPQKMYRDLYFDKRAGELSKRAIQFRAIVQDILDKENARRTR